MSTDGLLEARHPDRRREFFGSEIMAQVALEELAQTDSLSEAGLGILRRARDFAGGQIHHDLCLLLARRTV